MKDRWQEFFPDKRGVVVVVTALAILVVVGLSGLALDLGHLYVAKSELQRAADAGAMAGARAIFFPENGSPPQCSAALTRGTEVAQANQVDGASPSISQIQTGRWDWNAGQFTPGCTASPDTFTNAVRLTARRENIPLSFMGLFGFGPFTMQVSSTAAMDWVGGLKQGAGFVLAIWKGKAQSGDLKIYLNPDKEDVGGWYAKAPEKANASTLKGYLDKPQTIPPIQTGDIINLNNGVMASVIKAIQSSYLNKTVWLAVVDTNKFVQSAPVEGFTPFKITGTGKDNGKWYISGIALGLAEAPGYLSEPGGPSYGLLSSTRLVQ